RRYPLGCELLRLCGAQSSGVHHCLAAAVAARRGGPFALNFEALFVSTGVVALAELGDKTQLLAIVLAARFRAPLQVILGILAATAVNHTLAAWVGTYV